MVKLTVGVSCRKPDVGTVIVNWVLVTVKSTKGDPVISVPVVWAKVISKVCIVDACADTENPAAINPAHNSAVVLTLIIWNHSPWGA